MADLAITGYHDYCREIASNDEPPESRPKYTWRCDGCGAEWDHFTYGGPCPCCPGELHRRKRGTSGASGLRTRAEARTTSDRPAHNSPLMRDPV